MKRSGAVAIHVKQEYASKHMLFALVPKGKKDYLQVADEDSRIQKQIENAILVLNLICWNEWLKLRK